MQIVLEHRINSVKTDAMVVESGISGNAKLKIIFGSNRNFGIDGINEAGTIAINGDAVSKWNPMPLVYKLLNHQKKRKAINRKKRRSWQYNIGILKKQIQKKINKEKNRSKLQHIARPNMDINYDMNKIKSKIKKMSDRKKKTAEHALQRQKEKQNNVNNNNNKNNKYPN